MSDVQYMSAAARSLVQERLSSQLRKLEADLTVGNYFDRIGEINAIKSQMASIQAEDGNKW